MENNICDYCGYKEELVSTSETVSSQAEQPTIQSQVIINHEVLSDMRVVPEISQKSKIVALFLCFFLGVLGIHRFYVGKVKTGFLYLFTYGLCGIGWIVDIIMIAVGSFKDKFDLPLRQ